MPGPVAAAARQTVATCEAQLHRGGWVLFFCAFTLTFTKQKRKWERKEKEVREKAKAPSAKEKIVNSRFFFSTQLNTGNRFQSPNFPRLLACDHTRTTYHENFLTNFLQCTFHVFIVNYP
jgi:hypothetical protein